MRLKNRQEILTLIFEGVVERLIIGEDEAGWHAYYVAANGFPLAHIEAASRETILQAAKDFLIGHGQQVMLSVIGASEIYLGTMNLQPTGN